MVIVTAVAAAVVAAAYSEPGPVGESPNRENTKNKNNFPKCDFF